MAASDSLFVKLLNSNARAPSRQTSGAAGYDVFSSHDVVVPSCGRMRVDTGVAIALPEGTYGRLAPRSSLAYYGGIDIGGGVIDYDYRGEISIIVFNHSGLPFEVKKGDRIAQLIIERIATPPVVIVDTLDETKRGEGGFGSTGK